MKNIFWILLFFYTLQLQSQSNAVSFFKLSSPEKWWVIFHPFKAKKALIISQDALKVTDSISKSNLIKNDINGGRLDAFKHSYWMASLSQSIGDKPSLKLGFAHEKGNYKSFKRNKLEDGFLPDKISSEMDLYNNNLGANIAIEHGYVKKEDLIEIIIVKIKKGEMKMIKKDSQGNFLNCKGNIIPTDSFRDKWENDKCLIDSNDSKNDSNLLKMSN